MSLISKNTKQVNRDKFTFMIDGNYLMNRLAFGSRLTFKETPVQDSQEFVKSLCTGFSKLVKTYGNTIDHVIIAKDGYSWRKDVEMIVPESLNNIPKNEARYKANRNKDESPIDMKVVDEVFTKFVEMLDEKFNVPLLTAKGAEGDDFMYLIAREEVKRGKKVLIYTSDGDSHQLVNDNVFILKQMPNERDNIIVMNESNMDSYFPNKDLDVNPMFSIFGSNNPSKRDNLISHFDKSCARYATPVDFLLLKICSGDKKDNIHPTFCWKKADKNGKINTYTPTTMFIKKALGVMDMTLSDVSIDMLFDEHFIETFMHNLIKSAPLIMNVKDVKRNYKANLKELFKSDGDFKEILYSIVCGENPIYNNSNLKSEVFSPTEKIVDNILSKLDSEFVYETKTLKNNKFITRFIDLIVSNHPLTRCLNLSIKMFKQNRTLLYLNETTIPNKVMDDMQIVYDSKLDKQCDMETIMDYRNLLGSAPITENIFEGATDDDLEVVSDEDVDDFTSDIFSKIGIDV